MICLLEKDLATEASIWDDNMLVSPRRLLKPKDLGSLAACRDGGARASGLGRNVQQFSFWFPRVAIRGRVSG